MKTPSPSSPCGFPPPSPLAFTPTKIEVEQVAEMSNHQCEGGSPLLPVTPQAADVGKSDQGADVGKSDRKDFQDFPISTCVKDFPSPAPLVLTPVSPKMLNCLNCEEEMTPGHQCDSTEELTGEQHFSEYLMRYSKT